MNQQSIIAAIEDRAARLGITIGALCRHADVHPTTFSRWKKSERNPEPIGISLRTLKRLHSALDAIEFPTSPQQLPERGSMSASPTHEQLVAARISGFRKGMESAQRLSFIGGEVADEADQVREALKVIRRLGPSVLAQQVHQFIGVLCGAVGAAWQQLLGRGDVSLDQVVQGVEAVGQGRDHAVSPSNGYADDEETIARRIRAHRLSETSK